MPVIMQLVVPSRCVFRIGAILNTYQSSCLCNGSFYNYFPYLNPLLFPSFYPSLVLVCALPLLSFSVPNELSPIIQYTGRPKICNPPLFRIYIFKTPQVTSKWFHGYIDGHLRDVLLKSQANPFIQVTVVM